MINYKSKFKELGTIKLEKIICRLLKELLDNTEILQDMFDFYIRPRLYDLNKLYKTNIPLIRIVHFMVGSS